jgi:sarcosine oxidase delta subunit
VAHGPQGVACTPRGVEIEEFVERVCALSDQLNLAAAAGIEFLVSDQAQLLEEAHCGVCGDNLASDLVVCRRCNTPHHRECWHYGGGCATYGCGGRDCAVPGIAPLARPHWDATNALDRSLKPR